MSRADFNELVHALSRKMYGIAFRILGNQEEAEDAVQEVLIKLWNMGDRLNEYSSKEALVSTMIKNHSIDQIRKRKSKIETEVEKAELKINTGFTPHEELENRESGDIIRKIINALPEALMNIVIYRDIDDLSYEEIAAKTGQNVNALRVSLSRARKQIRDEYNKYHYEQRGT